MRYFSLFSGIGGFELGIGNSGKCVGYSEIDKYAIQVYQKHFPNHKNYGDITKIDERGLPDFDLLCGGFPCQSFSIAGKRGGFEDTRGTLFFHIARIAKYKRPRFLLLENVKGLLSHDGGRTFNTIIAVLDELGYDLQWQVLNSKYFTGQTRSRVFILADLRGGVNDPKYFLSEKALKFILRRCESRQKNIWLVSLLEVPNHGSAQIIHSFLQNMVSGNPQNEKGKEPKASQMIGPKGLAQPEDSMR